MNTYPFDDLERRILSFGVLVESAFGPTRELLGQRVRVSMNVVEDILPFDEAHPEYVDLRPELCVLAHVLQRDPGSRRAVHYLGKRSEVGEELACLPLVQFLVRDDRLEVFAYARSLDVRGKLRADARALTAAGREVLERVPSVASDLGYLHLFAASAHVYV